jgi:hypothetical protein
MGDNVSERESADAPYGSPLIRIDCVPPPEWIEHEPFQQPPPGEADGCTDRGVQRLLNDSQVRLHPGGFTRHHRLVQRVLTRTGAEQVANFGVEFDPAFERLDIHWIRIVRGNEVVEHARSDSFRILRREKQLERLALNGRLTASLLIPDVRVDDLVDVAMTYYGSNPLFRGRYTAMAVFNSFAPWLETRHRLIRPTGRSVDRKPFNEPPVARVESDGRTEESTWRLIGQPRREAEPFTPPWLMLLPTLQFTEFESWGEVARLFEPHYTDDLLPAEAAAVIGRLESEYPDPADRVVEWLRCVQRELRYFALSFGEGGFIPRSLDAIWASRFGDCKDAARLYVAGARRLGLDACAALVSTTHGFQLCELLPAPNVFNHCIVRLRFKGNTYWLDPTMQKQAGSLDNVFQPHAGWALPIASDTSELEALSSATPMQHIACDDELHVGPRPSSRARLLRRVDYFRAAADGARHQIENAGTAKFSEQMLKQLGTTWPGIMETAPMSVRDDPVENRLSAFFTYEIAEGWQPRGPKGHLGFRVTDDVVAKELGPITSTQRRSDILLGRPRKATWSMRMHMPYKWYGKGWRRVMQESGFAYTNRLDIKDQQIEITKELVVETWSIPADQAGAYSRVATQLRENITLILGQVLFGRVRPAGVILVWFLQAVFTVLVVGLIVGLWLALIWVTPR